MKSETMLIKSTLDQGKETVTMKGISHREYREARKKIERHRGRSRGAFLTVFLVWDG